MALILTLIVACRDPRTHLSAKIVSALTALYALSPIDLIPDVIPILGIVDDLILLPLGVWLARILIDQSLFDEFRACSGNLAISRNWRRLGGGIVIATWVAAMTIVYHWI